MTDDEIVEDINDRARPIPSPNPSPDAPRPPDDGYDCIGAYPEWCDTHDARWPASDPMCVGARHHAPPVRDVFPRSEPLPRIVR